MIYAVVPLDDDKKQHRKKIEEIDKAAYLDYAPDLYFVSYSGTARQLAEKLGFSTTHGKKSGLVLEVDGYSGYAYKDLWTWLSNNE